MKVLWRRVVAWWERTLHELVCARCSICRQARLEVVTSHLELEMVAGAESELSEITQITNIG